MQDGIPQAQGTIPAQTRTPNIQGRRRLQARLIRGASLLLCAQLAGCATMIFHNGLPAPQHHLALNTINLPHAPGAAQLDPSDAALLSAAATVNATATEAPFVFEHEVKTSENIFHYLSGQSTTAITLSEWCSPNQWQAIKTEQSAWDMIVRWVASPLYAINSLSVSCADASQAEPDAAPLLSGTGLPDTGPDLATRQYQSAANKP